MTGRAPLRIVLENTDHARVTDARVTANGDALRLDERIGAFVGEVERAGDATLVVDARGYAREELTLQVSARGLSTTIVVGEEGQPYYVSGGRRMYYAPRVTPEAAIARDVIVGGDADDPHVLTNEIELVSHDNVSREEIEEAIREFGLRIVSQNAIDPRLYRVRFDGAIGADFGALPEGLMALPIVRHAASIVSASMRPAATPGDVLFPLQFPMQLMRVPEAWDVLGNQGSADIIVGILDTGIQTTTTPNGVSTATHPSFAGDVTGGTLSGKLGNSKKLVHAMDFNQGTAIAGNDNAVDDHGSGVAGLITAPADAVGMSGIAPNTRLASYFQPGVPQTDWSGNSVALVFGQNPGWNEDDFNLNPVAYPLNSGRQLEPPLDVLNWSFTNSFNLIGVMRQAIQRGTLFGRERRGVPFFAAGGNDDKSARAQGKWAEDTNTIRVAASSLDGDENETRAVYSSWSDPTDPILDIATPSASMLLSATPHNPPHTYGQVATHMTVASGNLSDTLDVRIDVAGAVTKDLQSLAVAVADFGSFAAGQQFILRDKGNPAHAELHTIQGLLPPQTLALQQTIGFAYAAGAAEIVRLTGAKSHRQRFGGTSGATAQASAVAGLMLSANPKLTWLEVRDILHRTAVPIALRLRGTVYLNSPEYRYRWVDANDQPLLDANGLLIIDDELAPDRRTSTSLARGARFVQLDNAGGIAPRQALLFGAETTLAVSHPQPNPQELNVARSDSFEIGDTIFLGPDVRTVLTKATVVGASHIVVASVDGIVAGDAIDIGGEPVTVVDVRSLKTSNLPANDYDGDASVVLNVTPAVTLPYPRGTRVTLLPPSSEGPFKVINKAPNLLLLDKPVLSQHPSGRIVRRAGTELRAVIRVLGGNKVEIDPLGNAHALHEHVRIGRIADYSHSFGRGRIDALEAVKMAKAFTHDERDLMLRAYVGDDGKTKDANKQVESPDIWVRNDAQSPATLGYDETPHQAPEITIDPAIHIGAGRNDLEVAGTCNSALEVTFEIEIDATTDHFNWSRNGAAPTQNVAITGALQDLSDGVKIKFASTSGHTVGDKWIVRARQVGDRHLHARVRNRGTLAYFAKSTLNGSGGGAPFDVAQCRVMLCVSEGYPVRRFISVAFAPGPNDLHLIAPYNGPKDRARVLVEVTAISPSGDTIQFYSDGVKGGPITLAADASHTVDGFTFKFDSHTGHHVGDRWTLAARKNDAFLNVDHYWDAPPLPPVPVPRELFDPTSGRSGTRVLQDTGSIDGLAAGASQIHHVAWPEALRPPTNNPNAAKSTHPRRFFLLAEVVPHDGALNGVTPATNNNLAYREIAFAKFRFAQNNGATALDGQLDVDANGIQTSKDFRVEVRTTCGTFNTEKVRLRFVAKKGASTETRLYRFNAGSWSFDNAPTWATAAVPKEARRPDGSQPAATGEQFDIAFECSMTVDRSFDEISIAAEIVSDFRDHVVASGTHTIAIIQAVPLPLGTGAALAATQPKPRSHVFADVAQLTQHDFEAFGPVIGEATNKYRVTALFTAAGDVKAYAVTRSLIAIQRDPNLPTFNIILRPLDQPIAGFTPIKYFVYRGLRVSDYFKSAKLLVDAPALPFLQSVRTTFLAQNSGVTDMPASVFGYDPDSQNASDSLDALFFRTGSDHQLPVIQSGDHLGWFVAGQPFGFEIVVDEGGWSPTLDYARKQSCEIDVTNVSGFARRVRQEEILNFLDPAAFYGLHMHDGGIVRSPNNAKSAGADIYTNVIDRFFTRNRVYVDIRNENGSSLNFQSNYDVGGNQLQQGHDPGAVFAQPYAASGWPIVYLEQDAWPGAAGDTNTVYLRLPRNDNTQPVLYVAHGKVITAATDGAFVRGEQLIAPNQQWTETVALSIPKNGDGPSKVGVAWILRLFYGRLIDPAAQIPDTVLKTSRYTDNVWGPIDRTPSWSGNAAIKWTSTQDDRYVDGPGWRQMMQCGLAIDTGTQRVLLYASATGRDFVVDPALPIDFAPLRGMPSGISQKKTFFDEPGLFGVFQLESDQTRDGATTVRTLQLGQSPERGFAPTSALILGITKSEFDTLVALDGGISKDYLRTLTLTNETAINDPDRPATRYTVGIQGLKTADGKYATLTSSVQVYTVDGLLFASKAFTDAEPLATNYARNYEEAIGAREWPQRERKISSVDGQDIVINNVDWREEVVAGGRLNVVANSTTTHDVGFVAMNGNNTVITLIPNPNANAAGGKAITIARPVEDRMIDLDQAQPILGIPTTRTLVDAFIAAVNAIPNDASAKNAILAKIDDQGAKILERARELAKSDRAHAETYERALYWARNAMTVAVKSHPLCLASISARNELLARLERKSRGYDVDFGGATRKVLLLGFDPFDLHLDVTRSNPAGAIALALHDTILSVSNKNATIASVILPLRYRDFDAGVIEDLIEPLIKVPNGVTIILSLGENDGPFFDLERIASRKRLGYYDNERMTAAPSRIGVDAKSKEFYESTLPAADMVPGPFNTPPAPSQKLFFNQAYTSEDKSFDSASNPQATPGANANTNAYALNTITGNAISGSAGAYFANEVFYRIARAREETQGSMKPPTGHLQVPTPDAANVGIAGVIAEVEDLLERWLAGAV